MVQPLIKDLTVALYLKGGYINLVLLYLQDHCMGGCSCGLGKASKYTFHKLICVKKFFLKNPIFIGIDFPCISAKGIFSTVVFTTNDYVA